MTTLAAFLLALTVGVAPETLDFGPATAHAQARIEADGCLTSVRVGGVEFFRSDTAFPRGAYLFRDSLLTQPAVHRVDDKTVEAAGDHASSRFAADDDGLTWTITNTGAKPVLGVIVFEAAVKAVHGDDGRWAQPPVNRPWHTTTWFREGQSLRIEGGTRIWGPWGDHLQVWQVDVPAGQTASVVFRAATADAAELARAAAVATAPPPAPPKEPTGPMWDLDVLSRPPHSVPAEGYNEPGVRAVFFDGPPYQGQPTRVFAWIGLPNLKPGEKAPGMVLVHGGGGTAFASWVRLWTERGYAAISMDTCGCVPQGSYGNWHRDPQGGPPGWGGMDQIDEPREDQWTYHAVADAILAHSLLRSLPEVDAARIGLTGISWGGYLACILAGVDSRYRFAVPVYGCGFTNEHGFADSIKSLGKERGDRWMRWWGPSAYLKDARLPMLWVTGTNDFAYTFNALQKSYRLAPGPHQLAIRLRMPHGHGPAGEGPKEIAAYADSFLRGGPPLPKITGSGRDGRSVWATFEAKVKVPRAELLYTRDGGHWQDRLWLTQPAAIDGGKVTATLPEGTRVWFINLYDERDCAVSTEHEEIEPAL